MGNSAMVHAFPASDTLPSHLLYPLHPCELVDYFYPTTKLILLTTRATLIKDRNLLHNLNIHPTSIRLPPRLVCIGSSAWTCFFNCMLTHSNCFMVRLLFSDMHTSDSPPELVHLFTPDGGDCVVSRLSPLGFPCSSR